MPYNVPGCFAGDRHAASTMKAPSPPPCDPLLESNTYCAQACIDWAPRIPEIASSWGTFYVATQDGYACFCGAEEHAQRYLTEANKVEDAKCNSPCGCAGKNGSFFHLHDDIYGYPNDEPQTIRTPLK